MTDEKILDFLVEFKSNIVELNTMMKNTLERIANHEGRITTLETNRIGLKDDFLKMLIRTLTISIIGLIVLGGGGVALIKLLPFL